MPSTAVTSALPITANCTSCSGVQLTLAPRSSAVVTPLLRRQLRRDRGTVDARQRLQHEARDRHQRAGVAGRHARLRRAVLDEVDRRRASTSPSSCAARRPAARPSRRLRCAAWIVHAVARGRARLAPAPPRSGASRPTRITRASGVSSRNASAAGIVTGGTVVASHRVNGDRDGHVLASSSGKSCRLRACARLLGPTRIVPLHAAAGTCASRRYRRPRTPVSAPPAPSTRDCREQPARPFGCVKSAAPTRLRSSRVAVEPRQVELLVGLGLDDLLAAIVAAGADVMAQVRLAADRLDGERRARSGNRARDACRASTATSCSAGQP